tara:strand:+ start:738 stop:1427 length:690 start_codon:yes stop_codon:yes gene_type:complete
MSKLKLLAASLVMVIMASTSFAGISEGKFRIGIGYAETEVNATGSEVLKSGTTGDANAKGRRTKGASKGSTAVGHLFLEKTFSNGFTLGFDYVPGEASIGTKSRTDTNSFEGDASATRINKASAQISNHVTYYGLMPFGSSPIFIKGGVTSMDVETKEVLGTGAKYGNESVNGVTAGIGAHLEKDNGLFIRIEANVSEYESISLTGTTGNIIEADLDTAEARFSIGKSF